MNNQLDHLAIPINNLLVIDFNNADHHKNKDTKINQREYFRKRSELFESHINKCEENPVK